MPIQLQVLKRTLIFFFSIHRAHPSSIVPCQDPPLDCQEKPTESQTVSAKSARVSVELYVDITLIPGLCIVSFTLGTSGPVLTLLRSGSLQCCEGLSLCCLFLHSKTLCLEIWIFQSLQPCIDSPCVKTHPPSSKQILCVCVFSHTVHANWHLRVCRKASPTYRKQRDMKTAGSFFEVACSVSHTLLPAFASLV